MWVSPILKHPRNHLGTICYIIHTSSKIEVLGPYNPSYSFILSSSLQAEETAAQGPQPLALRVAARILSCCGPVRASCVTGPAM